MFWNTITMSVAPRRPRPAVNSPIVPPARNATCMAASIEPFWAAAAVRTFALVASHIPRYPMNPEKLAPKRKASVRQSPDWTRLRPSPVEFSTSAEVTNTTTARGTTIIRIVRNWRLMYAMAPSWIASAISFIFSLPVSFARTPRIIIQPTIRATTATTAENASQNHSLPASPNVLVAAFGEHVEHWFPSG